MLRHRRTRRTHQPGQSSHVALRVDQSSHQAQASAIGEHPQGDRRRLDHVVAREWFLPVTGSCNVVACVHGHILSGRGTSHQNGGGVLMSDHDHSYHGGWWERLRHQLTPHSHDSADKVDPALESSREGLRALWISLVVLGVTAALQAGVVVLSGSVALLGDTLHNVADALTAVPLGIAFLIGRRAATRAYTYGFGRAEDLAGVVIVLVIAGSAVTAGWLAVDRLIDPQTMTHIPWVFAAGVIGFLGNEVVARYRITVGRRIGSAALVADGLHARTDG